METTNQQTADGQLAKNRPEIKEIYVAVDVETQSFDKKSGITPENAKIEGISIAYDNQVAEYVTDPARWNMLIPETATVIFHKAAFDLPKLAQAGVKVPNKWEDTKISAFLLNENRLTSLKPLAKQLLGVSAVDYKDVNRGDPAEFAKYARNDALWTYRLWTELFKDQLEYENLMELYELEKKFLVECMSMQKVGMHVDTAKLGELATFIEAELERSRNEVLSEILLAKLDGLSFSVEDINLNSSKQVAELLYKKLKLPVTKKTKKGALAVDKEALANIDHPIAYKLTEYKAIQKLASSYTYKLIDKVDEDGRIRPNWNSIGPVTGRVSANTPNLMQIPVHSELGKKIRECFTAPEGKKLVIADFSQVELRILAHFSLDPALKEAFLSDQDLHERTACAMLGKTEVSKEERFISKMINFGIIFGLTPEGLFKRLKTLKINVTLNQCHEFIEKYFQTYPKVRSFLDRISYLIRTVNYVTSMKGRRRRLSGRNYREIRQAINFVIQGSAADLFKMATVEVANNLPGGAKIVAQVHDEIIVEVDTKQAEAVKQIVVDSMLRVVPKTFGVPVKVSADIADDWGSAK